MDELIVALSKPQIERAQYFEKAHAVLRQFFPNQENLKNLYVKQNIGYERHDALRYVLRHNTTGVKCYIIL